MELRTSSNLRANGGMKNDIIVTDGIKNTLMELRTLNTLMELRTSSNLRAKGGMKNDIIVTDGIKNTLMELRTH